ncbi:MAG: FAD-dependent oxidoreductase [Burkholderiaceae bacterium]|nr:FAD-dependent oxidoreductase [Burkholderiaceae bacterium]
MKIAVIGSGISGCAAAWELSSWAQVSVFESDDRLGGHTHTQHIRLENKNFPVDTGFIVFNHRTYPGLRAWFDMLGVETAASDMSFSASLNRGQIEWCGTNLNTVFAQRRNLISPRFWSMLKDILRFNRQAPEDAARFRNMADGGPSLGEYLDQQRYGPLFLNAYLLPMAGAIWSCPTEQMRAFPMATFTRFCENHGLLAVSNRPQWYTVRNGSATYIHKLQARIAADGRHVQWQTQSAIDAVVPIMTPEGGKKIKLQGFHTAHDAPQPFEESFDAVVLTCHSDQAAQLLPQASPAQQLVSKIRYQKNLAVLHTDQQLMPRRRSAWASWNYLHDQHEAHDGSVSVTYWMNRLQPLPVQTPVLVSLNPIRAPRPEHILQSMQYAHPIFDGPAVRAQQELSRVQGQHGIWLAGAWSRYGFHEDGFQSGTQAAQDLQRAFAATGQAPAMPNVA